MSPITTTALKILEVWYFRFESSYGSTYAARKRAALRWKAIGVVQHDRVLNSEPVPIINLISTPGLTSWLKEKPQR